VKRLVLFLIICSFLIQASIKTVIFIDWKVNQIRITELYCINKDNPLMHCNGQCYLSKQLKKIESDYQESKAPFNPKHIKSAEFLLYIENLPAIGAEFSFVADSSFKGGIYRHSLKQQYPASCFKPPCFSSDITLTA
jgi:hypothetical protein